MRSFIQRCLRLVPAGLACAWVQAAPIPYSPQQSYASPAVARQIATQLGYSVAAGGTYLAVSSPYDDTGGEDCGIVGIYQAGSGALVRTLLNPEPSAQAHFGWAVAVEGDRIVVGAKDDDSGAGDSGIVYVYDMGSATPGVPVFTFVNPDPSENDSFGYSVAISGNRVVVGCRHGDSGAADAGMAYVYDLFTSVPSEPVLSLPNPLASGQNFGHAVAISGSRVVVAAPQESGAGDLSRVHVYDVSSGTPQTPVASFSDASPLSNERFGWAVSVSGDKVAAGAPQDDSGADNSGLCYLYDFSAGTPSAPWATIVNPAPAIGDEFAASVSLSASRLAIGNALDDQGFTEAGRVYAYDLTAGGPVLFVTIENPGPQSGDQFGRSVSFSGTRLLTGAHGDNTGGSDVGSAYVYDFSGSPPPAPVFTINTPSTSSAEEFGTAVDMSGSIIVTGAHHDDKGSNQNTGTVFIYDRESQTPEVPVLILENPAPTLNDYFGAAVAIEGNKVAVAAYQDDNPVNNSGIVYIYDRTSNTPTVPVLTILNPAANTQDQFGNSLAMSGSRLVVGCAKNDSGATLDTGSAYVYDLLSGTPTVPVATLDNPAPAADDLFGSSVSIAGTMVIVGAPGNDTGAANAGSAYLYDVSLPAPYGPVAVFDNPQAAADDSFGAAVAISELGVVIGAHQDDTADRDAGAAYVYSLGDLPSTQPWVSLVNPSPEPEDYFGIAVAISGSRVVVGASEMDIHVPDGGAAYVYEMTSAPPQVAVDSLDCGSYGAGDHFGFSVAIDGVDIVVGAPLADGNTFDRGAAHLFAPDPPLPQMQVEQPPGTGLIGGSASIHFGNAPVGTDGGTQLVVIRNVGTASLQVTGIALMSGHTADFQVSPPALPVTLAVDQTATFQVGFTPVVAGIRIASLRITSNSSSNSPFDITLTGQSLAADHDTDGDGLNDVLELQLEALGFDWQVDDSELAAVLLHGANATGAYSLDQLQAMHPGMPLAAVNPGTGTFKLTVAVKKAIDLGNFQLLPMSSNSAFINGQGAIEFNFSSPDPKAFFRLEPR
ncbi:choice-of-anchor D domain-containing protein [Luteolibacter sp. GHJ8]|uniref:Choice-of-anchor D domain-containing protein n=1 Tax=Luteolibacter rhizosphaerae TaxID=2989719 RepID=A0ABT3G4M5_9BACT|nr:choice-of-anchor D domain-containing protein [Luteolibacter rhizosphaerae]MCW1914815.1 choice-of-anchor D domain-containing protein [Luteolibacter rhizosphaerae]